jgi:hypothetical protein
METMRIPAEAGIGVRYAIRNRANNADSCVSEPLGSQQEIWLTIRNHALNADF